MPLPKLHLQPAVPFPHPTAHLKHFIAPAWSLYLSVLQVTFQSLFTDLESCLFMWFYRLFLNVHIVWCFSLALFAVWIWMISLTPYRTSPYSQSFLSYKGCWVKGKAVNVAVLTILITQNTKCVSPEGWSCAHSQDQDLKHNKATDVSFCFLCKNQLGFTKYIFNLGKFRFSGRNGT